MTESQKKAARRRGLALLVSFGLALGLMFIPFGREGNLFRRTDAIFNGLAKGSSWFVPTLREEVKPSYSQGLDLAFPFRGDANLARVLLERAGAALEGEPDGRVSIKGVMGPVLAAALDDAASLYHNDGAAVSARSGGCAPLEAARVWWQLLGGMADALEREGKAGEARLARQVMQRAIEPGNNFYGIEALSMGRHWLPVCALLVFYLLYAVWYGFGMFELFRGFGIGPRESQCEDAVAVSLDGEDVAAQCGEEDRL